jgi:hypothetical protein
MNALKVHTIGLCRTNQLMAGGRFSRAGIILRDGATESGEAAQDGHTDLELGDLTVEVLGDEALAQQFHTKHLGFGAASAVVSAPSSPERTAEVFRRPQGLVARGGSRSCCLPRLDALAGRYDRDGPAILAGRCNSPASTVV